MQLARPPSELFLCIAVGSVMTSLIFAAVATLHGTPVSLANTSVGERSALGEPRDLLAGSGSVPSSAGLSLVGSVPVGSGPVGVVYDSQDANVDVLLVVNNLTVVSTTNDSVVQRIALPSTGYSNWGVAETYDERDGLIYVTQQTAGLCAGCGGPVAVSVNGSTGRIVAINTNLTGVDVPDYLGCLGFDPQNGIVYACDYNPGKLVLYDGTTDTILRSINVGSLPSSATFDPANGDVYVTNWGSDNVTVIDGASNKVSGWIPVGSEPDGITFDDANGFLYVANNGSGNVTVIDGTSNTVKTSIPVGCNPGALTYDSANGGVYVVNQCSDYLTAISGATNTVVGAVAVGVSPDALTYDSANQRVYVANYGSSNVTVFATDALPMGYMVTLTERGLLPGTEWFVNVTDTPSYGSTTDVTTLYEPNGTYRYSVATTAKEYAAGGGSFTVNGSAVPKSVTFALVTYTVTFSEVGLPSGTNWSLTVEGVTHYSAGTTIAVQEPNGSFAFEVGSVSGYAVNRSSGTVTVSGASTVEPLTFTSTAQGATFLGLPSAEGYAAVAGVVVVVAALAAVLLARGRRRKITAVPPPTPRSPPMPPGNS